MKKDTLHFGKRYSLTKGLYLYMSHNLYNYLANYIRNDIFKNEQESQIIYRINKWLYRVHQLHLTTNKNNHQLAVEMPDVNTKFDWLKELDLDKIKYRDKSLLLSKTNKFQIVRVRGTIMSDNLNAKQYVQHVLDQYSIYLTQKLSAMLLGIKKVHNPIILAKTTLVKKFKDALPFYDKILQDVNNVDSNDIFDINNYVTLYDQKNKDISNIILRFQINEQGKIVYYSLQYALIQNCRPLKKTNSDINSLSDVGSFYKNILGEIFITLSKLLPNMLAEKGYGDINAQFK